MILRDCEGALKKFGDEDMRKGKMVRAEPFYKDLKAKCMGDLGFIPR